MAGYGEQDDGLQYDEYGELFEDFGFLKRAELSKAAGNEAFKKDRFESALQQYDIALEGLLTVAYDKSILIGKKKMNDVIVLRSTLNLNRSTCFYKLKQWQDSLDSALECLVGSHRDEMMLTDAHVRHKVKESDRKHGHAGVTFIEQRLPRLTRAKAWFRASQCYGHLDYLDKAKDALAKALEMCDDEGLMAEISQHSLRIDTLERLQRDKQKVQFRGFWDKLQDRGGYADEKAKNATGKRSKENWDTLNYWEKYKDVEDFEEQYQYVDPAMRQRAGKQERPKNYDLLHHLPPGAKFDSAVKGLTKKMYKNIDQSFEEYLQKKASGEIEEKSDEPDPLLRQRGRSPAIEFPPAPPERVPPRPKRKEQLPISYDPRGGRPDARTRAARSPSPAHFAAQQAYSQHYSHAAKEENARRERYSAEAIDTDEEMELHEARERIAMQKWERHNKEKRTWLEALDDSD
eukprot:TRINITY_DN72068_c0_g1_i1.p1 TRINITY_DN72068_c0_g1~~TRINITY_DN72068_c0_g1_i1.p1  ORF type:complete len:461 (-),score=109.46 TRINITY_DN72068_c0_g1_i1:132-1514(-)